jgi:hypothetical protein
MKKITTITFVFLFGAVSLFAQESVEQRRAKQAQKKFEEAKVDHYKKINEARKEMEGDRLESLSALEKARKVAGISRSNSDSLIRRGYSIGALRNLTYVQGNLTNRVFSSENFKEVTYSISFSSGTLDLNFAPDSIEAYDGKEVILKSFVEKEEQELVDDLVLINSNGEADNTRMRLRVEKNVSGDFLSISEMDMQGVTGVKVMVPNAVKIILKYNSTYQNEKITLLNLSSELDVAVRFNPIVIKNVTGPVTINSMYGKIDAIFDKEPTMPVSLVSSYGDISVNMPSSSKVDVNLKTSWGKIYVPQTLVGKLKKEGDAEGKKEQLKGSLNGGGNPFILNSGWGKIYLRLK